jgi:multiple sugar transport system permease protein
MTDRARTTTHGRRSGRRAGPVLAHTFLVLCALALVVPFVWQALTSLKSLPEATRVPPTIVPELWDWANYRAAWSAIPMPTMFWNSIVNAVARTAAQLLFCAMAAYAFARLRFPGRTVLFAVFLSVLLVPSQLLVISQYKIIDGLHLLNTLPALFIPGMFSAFGTFLLRQFFLSLPAELEEAALLDGAGVWRIFWSVMLPLARPGLAALAILTTIWSWNDLLWPLIVNTDTDKMTLSVGLASMQGQFSTNYPVLMAAAFLSSFPVIVVFIVMQKQVIGGIALAGTKG